MAISHDGSFPYVEIIEQPASKALRFRYECEGRSAGSIPGVNSSLEIKTYPTIKIFNYDGRGVVVVSCVTKDQPYRPHPHGIVGKGACKDGICRVDILPGNSTVSFVNLGIRCVKRKNIADALSVREYIRVDPYRTGFDHKRQPSSVDLNAVRMCFQVFVEGTDGRINVPLSPVVSEPIYDKKAMSDLMICKLSHYSASVAGGMEMIVLCEKVAKDNIQVRFFEKRDGRQVWEGYGDFKSVHVHKQVAVTFRTPSYRDRHIDEPVQVYIELRRPSDGVTSEPLPFKLLPLGTDNQDYLRRKRRKFQESPRALVLRRIQEEAEKQGILDDEPLTFEYNNKNNNNNNNVDPLKVEARVQSFPVGGMIPAFNDDPVTIGRDGRILTPDNPLVDVPAYGNRDSPVSLPSPVMGYATAYDASFVANHQGNVNDEFETARYNREYPHRQQSFNVHHMEPSKFSGYYQQQQQSHRQQDTVLQNLTISQSNLPRNVNQRYVEDTVGGTDTMDIAGGHQRQLISDASLNQLDSADLAALGEAFSEGFSDGLSLTDHPIKIESSLATGTVPVRVGAAPSWCDM